MMRLPWKDEYRMKPPIPSNIWQSLNRIEDYCRIIRNECYERRAGWHLTVNEAAEAVGEEAEKIVNTNSEGGD
jgi:hypothetical protein